jgi:hypothetical protein
VRDLVSWYGPSRIGKISDSLMPLKFVLASRDSPLSSRSLSRGLGIFGLDELFGASTFAISRCRLNTIFNSEFFKNPLGRFFGLVTGGLALSLLECLYELC